MATKTVEDSRTDILLIERIAARDQSAVGELYDRHSNLLFAIILRIIRERGEAEDVLQEVFLSVWERAETYDRLLGSPTAWLVRIARNRAIDRLRSKGVRARVEDPDTEVTENVGDRESSIDPERSAASAEERQAVMAALGNLAPEQRTLIEYAYYLGFTQSELAERFNLPLGTVKTRIRTGMLALRQHLRHLV